MPSRADAGPVQVLHVIDKLSMDGVNPSSVAKLFVDWNNHAEPGGFRMAVLNLRYDKGYDFLKDHGVDVRWFRSSPRTLRGDARRVAEIASEYGAPILHAHGYYASYVIRLAKKHSRARCVVHEHAVLRAKPWFQVADWLLRKRTDRGVAVSRAVAEFMERKRFIPREKIDVVWNGIDLENFRPDGPREELRSRFGFGPSHFVVGMAARLREEKGGLHFIEAARVVSGKVGDVIFALAGEGPQRRELEQRVRDWGLSDRVKFVGHVDDVKNFLWAVDVVVVPSVREGFGLSVLEAMACDRPVIATRAGGIPEIIGDTESAVLVPPGDGAAIASAILDLYRNPGKAEHLRSEGRRNLERFTIERSTAELGRVYRRVLEEVGPDARTR